MNNVKHIFKNLSFIDRISYIENCLELLDAEYLDLRDKIILFNKRYKLIIYLLHNITRI